MIGTPPDGPGCHLSDVDDEAYKRIVLVDRDGLWVIVGRCTGQPQDVLEAGQREGRPMLFSLVKGNPRYWLYREMVPPASGRFNEMFHKDQV